MANTTGICETIDCPKGFYFGDPCYALDERLYDAWLEWGREREKTEGRWCNDGKFVHEGKEIMVVDSTAFGDGCYLGKEREYGVDAGCLAVIPLEYCTKEGFENLGLVIKEFNGAVSLETDGEAGSFHVEWGAGYEEVETSEYEGLWDEEDYEEETEE